MDELQEQGGGTLGGGAGRAEKKWYVGFIEKIFDEESVMIVHMVKENEDRLVWKRDDGERPLSTSREQLLDIAPVGDWDFTARTAVFRLNRDCKTAIIRAMDKL